MERFGEYLFDASSGSIRECLTTIEASPGQPTPEESAQIIRKSLKSLSKKELTELLIKFAPIDFLEEIRNRNAPEIDAAAIFRKAEKAIKKCFTNDELLYDPEGMESALLHHLNKLKGLEPKIQTEIGDLLLYTIQSVDMAIYKGYLYTDDWYENADFETDEICEYISTYVRQLPFDEKMSYVMRLDDTLESMSCDTFFTLQQSYPDFFLESEKTSLIEFIDQNPLVSLSLVSCLYEFVAPDLDEKKKESMLIALCEEDLIHVKSLCELFLGQERYQECHDLILDIIQPEDCYVDINLVLIYLKVAKKLGQDPVKSSLNAIQWHPSLEVVHEIKKIFSSVDTTVETLLRKRSPTNLLSYYEKEKRLEEALVLVNEPDSVHDSTRFSFFRKHGKLFPMDTEAYLVSRIEEDLNHTGDRYYSRIAESLDLFKRINPERCARITEEIRTNFKRRRNLINMLQP